MLVPTDIYFKKCIISKNMYGVNNNYVIKFLFSSLLTCFNPNGNSPLATSKATLQYSKSEFG